MAQVMNGRYTARMDEPFVVFTIGMWLLLHKDTAQPDHRCAESLIQRNDERDSIARQTGRSAFYG